MKLELAEERIKALEAALRKAQEALEPFSREAWTYEPDDGDDDETLYGEKQIMAALPPFTDPRKPKPKPEQSK